MRGYGDGYGYGLLLVLQLILHTHTIHDILHDTRLMIYAPDANCKLCLVVYIKYNYNLRVTKYRQATYITHKHKRIIGAAGPIFI